MIDKAEAEAVEARARAFAAQWRKTHPNIPSQNIADRMEQFAADFSLAENAEKDKQLSRSFIKEQEARTKLAESELRAEAAEAEVVKLREALNPGAAKEK